jgi:hypothetical protein
MYLQDDPNHPKKKDKKKKKEDSCMDDLMGFCAEEGVCCLYRFCKPGPSKEVDCGLDCGF